MTNMATTTAAQDEFDELVRDKERRTAHPSDDRENARSFLNLSENDNDSRPRPARGQDFDEDYDDDNEDTLHSRTSLNKARHTIPRTRYGANTGPKGVISDAQDYRDSQREHQRGSAKPTHAPSAPIAAFRNGLSLQEKDIQAKGRTFVNDEDDDDHLDGDDDEFMTAWRSTRLTQLQNGDYQSQIGRDSPRMLTVDADGYLHAIENAPSHTNVAVYIYDDASEVSLALEGCLRVIAKSHANTQFIRLHYTEAEMEPAGVPALIAYRGGDKFVGLVPLVNELPDDADLDAATLAAVLKRHQVI